MKKTLKNILIFISYFIYEAIFYIILNSFNIKYSNLSMKDNITLSIIFDSIYILFLIFIYRKELKEELKDFKTNYKKYIPFSIILYVIGLSLMFISNLILIKITNYNTSGNEELIRKYIQEFPLIVSIKILIAPIIEEFIFRKSTKNIFKNKYVYIILSGFIFGILHISNYSDINEILFSIPYILMGFVFAYICYKTNNIFNTLSLHFSHNLVLLIIQLL